MLNKASKLFDSATNPVNPTEIAKAINGRNHLVFIVSTTNGNRFAYFGYEAYSESAGG